ncbi:protein of unknown function [Candidatus Promineifilum breve]|uniref:Uncharacterized protein n=1 Tax=Candidatus Promineifilum breve TaxID=1806508 RepID=A0A160T4J8_9CHLR|nr:hypothetical protein [Candidatus Promineifilum breve]CUS04018.2 protein of unknown function [Candidatus Promineifilum breve]
MNSMRRAAIYKLAAAAHEMELDVMSGVLHRADDGRWQIGDHDLDTWLDVHSGEELVLVLGSLADEREVQVRTCRTCGRDYTELECPHCRANRIRLRGHA